MRRTGFAIATLLVCLAAGGEASAAGRWWFGGGLGLSFGTIDYVTVAPIGGYSFTPKLSLGAGVFYRFREDGRFEPSVSTSDYGGSIFLRYKVAKWVFLHGEYEHLNYEFIRADFSTERTAYNSFFAGPGLYTPLGENVSLWALGLYNFSYDDDDPRSPYSEPWVFRIGVGWGF